MYRSCCTVGHGSLGLDKLVCYGDKYCYLVGCRYGPDRALYLPGGLLDRSEVPSYLNGSLPGEYG